MATETKKAPAPSKMGGLLIWIILGVVATAGGAALPWFLFTHEAPAKKQETAAKTTVLPFGEVIVNLGEERLTRYLRVKILLVVEESESKEIGELLTKQKPFLKSWLIGHLADQSMPDVSRAVGVNRIRREVRDQFNAMLFPDGAEKIFDILFDEFVVQ